MPLLFVVDDNPDLCRMMSRMLSRFGYEVQTFTGGAQLLEHLLADAALPDLLILDYMMPEMDGCELLARIRVNPRTGGIPAVFYSAVEDERVFQRMRDCGADDYWIKSRIDAAGIDNGVRRILQSRGSGERPVQLFFDSDEHLRVDEAPEDRT